MYKDLSLKEKAKILLYGGKLGLTSVEEIAKLYDEAIEGHLKLGNTTSSSYISNGYNPEYEGAQIYADNRNWWERNIASPVNTYFNNLSQRAPEFVSALLMFTPVGLVTDLANGNTESAMSNIGAFNIGKDPELVKQLLRKYNKDKFVNYLERKTGKTIKRVPIKDSKIGDVYSEGFSYVDDKGEEIAHIAGNKSRGNNVFVESSYISPEFRNQGIGKQMYFDFNQNVYDNFGTTLHSSPYQHQATVEVEPGSGVFISPSSKLWRGLKLKGMAEIGGQGLDKYYIMSEPLKLKPMIEYKKGGPIVSSYDNYIPDNNGYRNDPNVVTGNKYLILDFEGKGYVPLVGDMNKPIGYFSNAGERGVLYPGELKNVLGSMVYEHPLVGNLALEGKKFNKEWKALDNILYNVYPDTSFTREKTGIGDIEVFNRENGDTIIYPNGYRYINPYPGLNTIVYNPNTNDALDIRLDALHLMPLDATYDALNTLYRNNALGSDVYYIANKRYEEDKRRYGKDNIDSFSQYYNNEADGLLRNMFIEGTPEYIKAKRYYPNKQQLREWNINLLPYINEIQDYLETGERPKYILPEVVITSDEYKKGGHLAQIGRKLRFPNRINRNTSSTLELSEDYETEMRLRISSVDPQYPIPYIPDKSILINGSTTSTNVLDSIVKYAGIHNRDLKPAQNPAKANPKPRKIEPYEAIGLGILETHLGAIPAMSIKRPSNATDDEWKQMLRAWYNANQFTAYGDIPSYALLNNYHWLDTNGSVHPLLDAMRYYSLGDYNTGDKNHTSDVKNAGLKVWKNLNIQDWWNNSGKYVYEGKPTPEQTAIVEFLKVDPLNYDRNGIFQYDAFGNPIKALGGNLFKKGGIYINPKNKGKFNATKKRTGKTTEELTHSKNPLTRKRAIFAQNAKKWSHKHLLGSHLSNNFYIESNNGNLSHLKQDTYKTLAWPSVDFLRDWYTNRQEQINNLSKYRSGISDYYNNIFIPLLNNFDLTRVILKPKFDNKLVYGRYFDLPLDLIEIYKDAFSNGVNHPRSTIIHEGTHAINHHLNRDIQKQVDDFEGDRNQYIAVPGGGRKPLIDDSYLNNPNEINSRLMLFRYDLRLDPKHKYTDEEILKFFDNGSLFKYNLYYSPEFVKHLINNVAYNDSNVKNDYISSNGGHLYSEGGFLLAPYLYNE